MKFSLCKKAAVTLSMLLTFAVTSVCFAAIERAVEPFTGTVTYSSKYTFSDGQRNMHSIALVKAIKPLKSPIDGKMEEVQIYFLLNFTMPNGGGLGDTFDIQVSPTYINALPLAPTMVSNISYSSLPTARTGPKDIPDMTKKALREGKELLVRVNFSPRGSANFTIPAEAVQEWAEILDYPKTEGSGEAKTEDAKQEQTNETDQKQ